MPTALGTEAGELELSADLSQLRARRGGARLLVASAEAEWLPLRRLGLRVEPAFVRSIRGSAAPPLDRFDLGATLSLKLLHDLVHDFHVQAEAGADLSHGSETYPLPQEPGLPFVFDVRAGLRQGLWTVRAGVGAGAGGADARLSPRASLALLMSFERSSRTGFFGLEAVADGAWPTPFFVAPNLVADLASLGLPMRLGVAFPWAPGSAATQPSVGLFLRLIVEPTRDHTP